MPSRMASMDSLVERTWSVSSIRRINFPPLFRASSQLKRAVRAPPMCRKPVGLGAKRKIIWLTIFSRFFFLNFILPFRHLRVKRDKIDRPQGALGAGGKAPLRGPKG